MKKSLFTLLIFFITHDIFSQCSVTASLEQDTIICGQSTFLSSYGYPGVAVMSENFNGGTYGPGWQSTQQSMWTNPCSNTGVDGTTHVWMGNSSPVPRVLTTTSFNLSTCTGTGVNMCFDLLFATQCTSCTSPCEGPDLPEEGVYVQYSTDNGVTWNTIHYFDPNDGTDPQLINWNNWCFPVPQAALTANVKFRWFQDVDSGADFDHWGLDNVVIYCTDPSFNMTWAHDGYSPGAAGGVNPNAVAPHSNTDYIVTMTNGTVTCSDTVTLVVKNPTYVVNAGNDTTICNGQCLTLNATGKVLIHAAETPTYSNQEIQPVTSVFGSVTEIEINVQGLFGNTITNNSINSVCIEGLTFYGFGGFPPAEATVGALEVTLICPDGTRIILVPSGVTAGTSTSGYTNTCFVPGGANIASGTTPYTGSYNPSQPFSNLNGCNANGVWTMEIKMGGLNAFGGGSGSFRGWNITFNDPEVSYTGNLTWSPTTNMTNSNTLSPTVCPPPTAYTLTIADTAGCSSQSDVINVNTQSCCALSASATTTQPTCGGSNGAINITPVPSGSYTFAWSDGPSTLQNRTGLAAGSYTVTVTSTVTPTCTFDTTIILNSNSSLTAAINVVSQPTCAGNDGSLQVTIGGGTGPLYTVTVDTGGTPFTLQAPAGTSPAVPGFGPGPVSITVTDAASCTASATVTLATPVCCSLSATTTTTQPTCGQSNGAINVTPTPAGSYTYAWSDGPSTLQNRTGLAAGNYTVTVTSTTVPTCTFSATVSLNSNSSLTLTFSNEQNPTCGASDGGLTATIAGGTAPFSLVIDTGGGTITLNPATSPQSVTGLPAGTILGTVQDAAGCTATDNTTLAAPNSPMLTISNPTDPTCAGGDGSIVVTLAGGTGPLYNVVIDTGGAPIALQAPAGTTPPVSGFNAGTINITVTDAANCTATASVTLNAATNCCTHSVSAAMVQPTCGQADGSITLTTSNGSGNYSYLWGGGETTPALIGIAAGNYTVTITDNGFANCFIDAVFSLTNPNAPVIDSFKILNVSCAGNGSDGSVSVYASSANGVDVTTGYTWSNTSTDTDDTQADLAPGTYLFTVTDLIGCSTPGSVTIGLEPGCCFLQISADMLPPSCGLSNASITVNIVTAGIPPYTYSVDGVSYQPQNVFSNLAPGSYTAIARDLNLCADTVAVTVPASSNNLNLTTTVTDVTCFGAGDGTATVNVNGGAPPYVYQWSGSATTATQAGLIDGTYTVTVVDANSCTGSATAFVTEPALLTINLGNDTTACEGTPIIVAAPAGFTSYLWSNGETTQTITPLVAATYAVTVTDANNCTASDAVDINLVPSPVVDLGDDIFGYEGENIGIFANINQGTATGGTYNWQPDTLLTCADCQNPVSYATDTITYVLIYTDNTGCTGTDNITLNIMPVGDVFWPNAFSPNGDGNNDVFLPYGSGVKVINWQMFNRWGEKVFESNNFFYGCDGTYKGAPMPMGVYVYSAKVVLMNNAERKFKGTVTLFR